MATGWRSASPHCPWQWQVQAEVDSGIGVKADFLSLRGDPGTAFAYTLTVTNNTPESQTFTFTAEGPGLDGDGIASGRRERQHGDDRCRWHFTGEGRRPLRMASSRAATRSQ